MLRHALARFAFSILASLVSLPAGAAISYGAPTFPATGVGPIDIVVADFNGDCNPDFATVNFVDSTVTIRFGDGSGGFPTAHTITGLADPESIVAGDFNGDGAVDLAVGNVGAFSPLLHTVQIYLNDGAGNFTLQAGTLSAASHPHALVAADFNGDGKLDLAAPDASGAGTGVIVFLGNGDGTFGAGTHVDVESPASNPTAGLVAADLNGDGHIDLASANGATLSWVFGNGDGTFGTPHVFTYTSPDGAVAVTAADVNHDGHIDLATAGGNVVAGASIFINSGSGTFTRSQFSMPQAPANPVSVTLADLDGDGNIDIVTADQAGCTPWGSNLAARPGNGDGTFGAALPISVGYGPTCINSWWQPNAVAAVDLNCDGKMDLISANENVNFVSVMLTSGGGTPPPPTISAPPPVSASTGALCSAVVSDGQLGTAVAHDSCGCAVIVRTGVPAGNVFPLGTTIVTYTVTAHGSTASATQSVTVSDTTPPTISAPPNITVTAGPSCTALVSLGSPTANDNCAGVTTSAARSDAQPLAAPFALGTTTVTYTATDAHGNSASATQIVTVNAPPVTIDTASVNPSFLWPPNHNMVDVTVNYTTSGGCGSVTCGITSITSNQTLNRVGDGNTPTDWQIVDAHHVRLRAERSGTGTDRVYTITITCTDGAGQTATRQVHVTVAHNQ